VSRELLEKAGECPLYPQKRTLVERVGMSALCQKRTKCSAPKIVYPIVVGGKLIGAIGVSGATSLQDHQSAEAGAAAVK
jgi:hypothetical protein